MSKETKIQPALDAEQHRSRRYLDARRDGVGIESGVLVALQDGATGPILDPAATMAMANKALRDDDPRKITRAHVRALRAASAIPGSSTILTLARLADALEAYLPPDAE